MKKMTLVFALLVTASNLAVGVAYAAACRSSNGTRYCGSTCTPGSDGSCMCSGACTREELDWVAAGSKVAEMAEMEMLAY